MVTAKVVVEKEVDARHPCGREMTPTQAVVNLRTFVSTVEGMLAEKEIIRRFIPRMEKIELGILQAKIFIHAQRDSCGTEAA